MSQEGFFKGMNRQQKRDLSKGDLLQGVEQLASEVEKLGKELKTADRDVDTLLDLAVKKPLYGVPVSKGNTLVIGFLGRLYKEDGTLEGMPFNGGMADKMIVQSLGSGEMIPGFEDQVIGQTVGTSFSIDVTFPGDFKPEQMASKKVSFLVVIHAAFSTPDTVSLIQETQKSLIQAMLEEQKKSIAAAKAALAVVPDASAVVEPSQGVKDVTPNPSQETNV